MYYQVTQNKLKTFKSYRGDTRQILDNLWKEDNYWREDKGCGPKVSTVRRFYCIGILLCYSLLVLWFCLPLLHYSGGCLGWHYYSAS